MFHFFISHKVIEILIRDIHAQQLATTVKPLQNAVHPVLHSLGTKQVILKN